MFITVSPRRVGPVVNWQFQLQLACLFYRTRVRRFARREMLQGRTRTGPARQAPCRPREVCASVTASRCSLTLCAQRVWRFGENLKDLKQPYLCSGRRFPNIARSKLLQPTLYQHCNNLVNVGCRW